MGITRETVPSVPGLPAIHRIGGWSVSERHDIHLISDSTGETLQAMARACLAPFDGVPVAVHSTVLVRTADDLEPAIAQLRARPGFVCYTLVDRSLRGRVESECAALGVPAVAVLDPLIAKLSAFFGRPPRRGVGLQHQLDAAYFERIGAVDFALAHDDGALGARLLKADVILTGVSRTSKTPTCVYLAIRGVRAANVPLLPGRPPEPELVAAIEAGVPVVGLTANPSRLVQIRNERLDALGPAPLGDRAPGYADLDRVQEEVTEARLFFERHALPVIDVTRRSIEETAAAILAILEKAQG